MATSFRSIVSFSGFTTLAAGAGYYKLPFQSRNCFKRRFRAFHSNTVLIPRRDSNVMKPYLLQLSFGTNRILSAGRNYQHSYNDDSHAEPFWLNLIREVIWKVQSLLQFLVEQPGQLKYIEWPSFQSTLKTATLTLVLVALLIVALSSVDSALSYLMALFLRRK